jgi:hypothetical protein
MDRLIREMHPGNINVEDGLTLIKTWRPFLHALQGTSQTPGKHYFDPYHPIPPFPRFNTAPFSFTCSLWLPLGILSLHSLILYSGPATFRPPTSDWLSLFSSRTLSRINNPTFSSPLFFILTTHMKMEQSVPKRRYIIFRRRVITQRKE